MHSLEQLEKALEEGGSERKAAALVGLSRTAFTNLLYKLKNLCIQCKIEVSKENCTRCNACLIKAKGNKTKEEKSVYNQEYREKNKDKLAEYNKNYQKNNLQRFRTARQKYDATSAGRIAAERRRIRRLGYADQGMPTFDADLLKAQQTKCENCGTSENLTLDHHVPLSSNGQLSLENTNILCNICNSRKRDKAPEAFFSPEILSKIQDKFSKYDAFKSVGSPKEYTVNFAPNKARVRNFISHHHYSETCPGVVYSATLEFEGRVLGAIVFSMPSRQNIKVEGVKELLELSRLFIIDGTPKNTESWFIAKALNWLKVNSKVEAVVSYADTTEGHSGAIYKACNFELVGVTRPNFHYETAEGERIHKRQVWNRALLSRTKEKDQALLENLTQIPESEKYKFIYKLKSNS